ncbi:hypothetical protein PS1_047761 [Malus domestica]
MCRCREIQEQLVEGEISCTVPEILSRCLYTPFLRNQRHALGLEGSEKKVEAPGNLGGSRAIGQQSGGGRLPNLLGKHCNRGKGRELTRTTPSFDEDRHLRFHSKSMWEV